MVSRPQEEKKASAAASGVRFEPIEPLRSHDYVAEQIRRHIGLGLIAPGESLPSERELARVFGVGHGTIQVALRMLEADGLLESRRGAAGGTFVLEPLADEGGKQRSLLELLLSKEQIADALVFRRVVELGAVRRAAEDPDPGGLEELRANREKWPAARTDRELHPLDTEFHVAIGRASGSELLREAVAQSRLRLNDAIFITPSSERWRESIIGEHEAILEAIEAGDPESAARVMDAHLRHAEKGIDALIAASAKA